MYRLNTLKMLLAQQNRLGNPLTVCIKNWKIFKECL